MTGYDTHICGSGNKPKNPDGLNESLLVKKKLRREYIQVLGLPLRDALYGQTVRYICLLSHG